MILNHKIHITDAQIEARKRLPQEPENSFIYEREEVDSEADAE